MEEENGLLPFDYHRASSCRNVNGSFVINYAPLYLEGWPGDSNEGIVLLDNIHYRSLQVTKDSCSSNGLEKTFLNLVYSTPLLVPVISKNLNYLQLGEPCIQT